MTSAGDVYRHWEGVNCAHKDRVASLHFPKHGVPCLSPSYAVGASLSAPLFLLLKECLHFLTNP